MNTVTDQSIYILPCQSLTTFSASYPRVSPVVRIACYVLDCAPQCDMHHPPILFFLDLGLGGVLFAHLIQNLLFGFNRFKRCANRAQLRLKESVTL